MLLTLLAAAIAFGLSALTGSPAQDSAPAAQGYAWAEACQKCHQPIYAAWARTKHATALDRLSGAEQEQACVGCHVTGPKSRVLDGKKVLNKGIQCESCHGAAAAHVADPTVKTGLVKTPPSSTCESCHSPAGPHFKGFWYDAMKGLAHRVS